MYSISNTCTNFFLFDQISILLFVWKLKVTSNASNLIEQANSLMLLENEICKILQILSQKLHL